MLSIKYTRLLVRTGSQIGFFVISVSANYYVTRSQPISVHLLERDSSLQFGNQLTWLQSPRSIHLLLSKTILDRYPFSQLELKFWKALWKIGWCHHKIQSWIKTSLAVIPAGPQSTH